MRSSRLLSILILMQLKSRVTAEALAREFEVSVRTIYRDMDALSAAGVPLYADKGPGGGFALIDGYRTKLTGLDRAEAAALPFASLPDAAQALGLGAAAASAGRKLLAALPAQMLGEAGTRGARVHIDTADWYQSANPPAHLARLADAVFAGRRIVFVYESWTKSREWSADPLGLVLKGGEWYLVATIKARTLTFKVAAMSNLTVADIAAERPPDFDLGRWWSESLARFEADLRPSTATIRASALGLERIAALGAFAAAAVAEAGPPDREGWRMICLPVETGDHSARALLGCGPEFEVIEPTSLRERIAELACAVLARAGQEGRASASLPA